MYMYMYMYMYVYMNTYTYTLAVDTLGSHPFTRCQNVMLINYIHVFFIPYCW